MLRQAMRGGVGELVVAAAGLAILAAIAFLPYVRRGGFVYDDWQEQAVSQLSGGFSGLFNSIVHSTPRRPLGAVYFALTHSVISDHEHVHLAFVAGLRVAASVLLFLVLRQVRIDRVSAGAIAALAMLFPYSDSTWLWISGGQMTMAVICWLGGLSLALHGLRSPTRTWTWQILAAVLYAASILIYEDTLIVVVLSGALYFTRAPRRLALRCWALGLAAAGLAFVLFTSRWVNLTGGTDIHDQLGVHATLHHIKVIADQGVTLAAASLVPFGAPDRWAVAVASSPSSQAAWPAGHTMLPCDGS
jgi:hypothetical protein